VKRVGTLCEAGVKLGCAAYVGGIPFTFLSEESVH
jgi:hypothetical protein